VALKCHHQPLTVPWYHNHNVRVSNRHLNAFTYIEQVDLILNEKKMFKIRFPTVVQHIVTCFIVHYCYWRLLLAITALRKFQLGLGRLILKSCETVYTYTSFFIFGFPSTFTWKRVHWIQITSL
jgi:hypothetical protein